MILAGGPRAEERGASSAFLPAPRNGRRLEAPGAVDPVGASARPVVLLVEDEATTALLMTHILRREGFEVLLARDGREASRIIDAQGPPLVVVTDMMLPYVDGFELIRKMRGNLAWSEVPIIVVTSKSQERDVVRALDMGADDYIRKPFRPEEFLARLRRCLCGGR